MGSAQRRVEAESITALEGITLAISFLAERGQYADRIVMHPTWTSRGYVFVADSWERIYIVVNEHDFNVATATLMMEHPEADLVDYCFGVPLCKDEKEFQRAIGGTYIWTLPLELTSRKQ